MPFDECATMHLTHSTNIIMLIAYSSSLYCIVLIHISSINEHRLNTFIHQFVLFYVPTIYAQKKCKRIVVITNVVHTLILSAIYYYLNEKFWMNILNNETIVLFFSLYFFFFVCTYYLLFNWHCFNCYKILTAPN